jgi:hypothetical protein
MSTLLVGLTRWIIRNLFTLALIFAVLLCGKWLYAKWNEAALAREQFTQLQAERPAIGGELLKTAQALERQLRLDVVAEDSINKMQSYLGATVNAKEAEFHELKRNSPVAIKIPTTKEFRRAAAIEMELFMLKQAQEKTATLTTYVGDVAAGKGQVASLNAIKYQADLRVYENKYEQWEIRAHHSVAARVPFSSYNKRLHKLTADLPELEKRVGEAQIRIDSLVFTVTLAQRKLDEAHGALVSGHGAVQRALADIDAVIEQNRRFVADSFFAALQDDFWPVVKKQLLEAIGILISILLVPIGIKMFFYYVVAPWASRQQPICVLPEVGGVVVQAKNNPKVAMASSGVSLSLTLNEDEELILHSEYIQSSSTASRKTTKWVLNWAYLLTNLTAGMYALTRILPYGSEPIVVSSSNDPLVEVAAVEVSQGSAIVFQPHSLVGVVQKRDFPLRITSHWRLGHLHSWLTLQLRYLVFHGPATLIIKGCRGVRLEPAQTGRLINQAATLGFSANLRYSVTRCETFVSYWRGEQELFNDQFFGESGVYIYEEMPSLDRKAGITGRGLEGLTDSVLKVFGV